MQDDKEVNKQWLALMKRLAFFKSFTEDELNVILAIASVTKHATNQYIAVEAEEKLSFYVLLKGTASAIQKDKYGSKQKIRSLNTGDCFGEIAILKGTPRSASVMASHDCYVFEIKKEGLDSLPCEVRMKIYRQFAVILADRLMSFDLK